MLSIGDGAVILGGVVGFVISFFSWYGISSSSGGSITLNAWSNWGVVSAILFLVGALVALGSAAGFSIGTTRGEAVIVALMGVVAIVTTIIYMVTAASGYGAGYDKGPLYGAYIGLICAIVMAIGGAMMAAEES